MVTLVWNLAVFSSSKFVSLRKIICSLQRYLRVFFCIHQNIKFYSLLQNLCSTYTHVYCAHFNQEKKFFEKHEIHCQSDLYRFTVCQKIITYNFFFFLIVGKYLFKKENFSFVGLMNTFLQYEIYVVVVFVVRPVELKLKN